MADASEREPLDRVKLPSGQELVRRRGKKSKAPADASITSIDEVAEKHRSRVDAPDGQRYHTPGAAVPPDVDDAAARELPTMEEIELTEEAFEVESKEPMKEHQFRGAAEPLPAPDLSEEKQKLRTLEDLNAHFPLDGSGQYFIMVERQAPLSLEGVSCSGRQRNITRRLTYDQFCNEYGGGLYVLTVYGPGRSRQRDTEGRIIPKALTKPIRFMVPHSRPGALAPNLFSAYEAEPEQSDSHSHRHGTSEMASALLSRRANTLPDARMLEAQLEHDRQMDQREREARREERTEKRREEATAIGAMKESASETMQILREQLQASQEEARELRTKGNGGGFGEALLLMEKMKGPDTSAQEIQRLRASYEEQLKNLREQSTDRVRDLDERHRRELTELSVRLERDRDAMVTSAARDKDDAVRRAEAEIERVVRQRDDLERRLLQERDQERERAQKEADRVEAAHQRQIESIHNDNRRVLESLQKDHERDLQSVRDRASSERQLVESSNQLAARLEKTTLESDLRRAQADLTQARSEIERLKAEVEKKGNLPKVLREAKQMAADLGMVEDDGKGGESEDLDVKQVALKSFVSIAQNLPAIIGQVTEAVKARGGGGGGGAPRQFSPAQGYAPPPPRMGPPMTQPMALGPWMSEETESMASVAPPPIMQGSGYGPPAVMPAPPPVVASVPAPAPMPAPAPQPRPQQAQQQPVMRPTTPSQGAPHQNRAADHAELAPAPAPASSPALSDEDIMQFAPNLEGLLSESIQTGVTPAEQAARVLAQFPQLKFVAGALTGEFIAEVLQRNGKASSPLVRRDGQRFITQFRAAILEAA